MSTLTVAKRFRTHIFIVALVVLQCLLSYNELMAQVIWNHCAKKVDLRLCPSNLLHKRIGVTFQNRRWPFTQLSSTVTRVCRLRDTLLFSEDGMIEVSTLFHHFLYSWLCSCRPPLCCFSGSSGNNGAQLINRKLTSIEDSEQSLIKFWSKFEAL